jgi:hypothetical protein
MSYRHEAVSAERAMSNIAAIIADYQRRGRFDWNRLRRFTPGDGPAGLSNCERHPLIGGLRTRGRNGVGTATLNWSTPDDISSRPH